MQRIIKETLANGDTQYVVETNKILLGLITVDWHIDSIPYFACGEITELPAIFSSLKEAEKFCNLNNEVIKREIVR